MHNTYVTDHKQERVYIHAYIYMYTYYPQRVPHADKWTTTMSG